MRESYEEWEVVPEETIQDAAEIADTVIDPDTQNFRKILLAGTVFKDAGMTPVYVWDESFHRLAVYAEETYGKKLH